MRYDRITKVAVAALSTLFALSALTHADAADMYTGGSLKDVPVAFEPPVWSGLYFGVNGGYGWRASSDQFAYAACSDCDPSYASYGGIGADGGFGGAQIGYNWQGLFGGPAIVTGIEADIQGAGIDGKAIDQYGEVYKTDLNWFGTVRGRIGYAAHNVLFYFTGGFAFGGLEQSAEDNFYSPTAHYKFDGTVAGYVLGDGIEYKFNPSWSLKAEYQYLNLGKNNPRLISGSAPGTASADGFKVGDDAIHTVRIGLNYHIHQAYEPLK